MLLKILPPSFAFIACLFLLASLRTWYRLWRGGRPLARVVFVNTLCFFIISSISGLARFNAIFGGGAHIGDELTTDIMINIVFFSLLIIGLIQFGMSRGWFVGGRGAQ